MNKKLVIDFLKTKDKDFSKFVDTHYPDYHYLIMHINEGDGEMNVKVENEIGYGDGHNFQFDIELYEFLSYMSNIIQKILDVVKI